jgi:hypothetical protein
VHVVPVLGDQVSRDAHDDERRDPVQHVVGKREGTVQLVRRALVRRAVVGRGGGVVRDHGCGG